MPPKRETAEEVVTELISEEQLQSTVVDMAHAFGWMVYHTHDSRRSPTGFPDLVLVRPPTVWFVELKSEKGKLTEGHWTRKDTWLPGQKDWLDVLKGCVTVKSGVWRPSDRDAIEALLR